VAKRSILRTLISRLLLFLLLAISALPLLIIILLPARIRRTSHIVYWLLNVFYRISLWCTLIPIHFRGKENIPKQQVIFVANHQSSLDIPLVGALANGHPHLWLARSELMDTIFLRIVLPRFAEVIDVNNPRNAMRGLLRIINIIKTEGQHLMIFPEGGRYIDDEVHEFFGGFALLAKKTGLPVVPIRIFGANKVYPPNTFWLHYHPVSVVIGKPFHYDKAEDNDTFRQQVYNWFLEQKE